MTIGVSSIGVALDVRRAAGGGSGAVFIPAGLGLDATYGFNPYLNDPGGMLTAIGDAGVAPEAVFDSKSTARSAPVTTYYHDPSRPDNSGNGLTLGTAKQTLSACITLGNASGQPYLIYTEGVENFRATGPAGTDPTQDCAIVARTGHALFGTHDNFTLPTKTDPTYTNLYVGTLANVNRLVNRLVQNTDGNNVDYAVYSAATHGSLTAALVAANASTGIDVLVVDSGGGKWYAIRADGAQPTPTNSRLYRSAVTLFNFQSNVNIYLENLDAEGSSPIVVTRSVQQTVSKVFVCKNVSAKYGGGVVDIGSRGFSIYNFKGMAYLYNCTAMANATDGFNFGDSVASGLQFVVVNPIANDNGRKFDQSGSTNQSCNGVTAHNGAVGMIIGGTALRCHGGAARFINTVKVLLSGLRANDLGDVVFGGTITPTAFQADNSCEMWCDRTKADVAANDNSYVVTTGAIQHMRNVYASPGTMSGAGTRDGY